MPSEQEERQHAPNTARTYERGSPENETPQGAMGEVRQGADMPDSVQGSVRNDPTQMEMTANDIIDEASTADPTTTRKTDADPALAVPNSTGRSGANHKQVPLDEGGEA